MRRSRLNRRTAAFTSARLAGRLRRLYSPSWRAGSNVAGERGHRGARSGASQGGPEPPQATTLGGSPRSCAARSFSIPISSTVGRKGSAMAGPRSSGSAARTSPSISWREERRMPVAADGRRAVRDARSAAVVGPGGANDHLRSLGAIRAPSASVRGASARLGDSAKVLDLNFELCDVELSGHIYL